MTLVPLLAVAAMLGMAANADAATFTVTTTATSGAGSLSKAITDANATAAADTINFNIAGTGPHVIAGTLPIITQPLTINGYSQPGSSRNTIGAGATNAVLKIQLDGSSLGLAGTIVRINAGPTFLQGVSVTGIRAKGNGVLVDAAVTQATIDGCFIGVEPDGFTASSSGTGISVSGTASIGLNTHGTRNLITGNAGAGVTLRGPNSEVDGNMIGGDRNGSSALGNGTGVIVLSATATDNRIGGNLGNEITASTGAGIRIDKTAGGGNGILGNSIHDNGGLGIDLGNDGVTLNDADDSDTGPNGLLNFPELTFARINGNKLRAEGFLSAKAGLYQVVIFRSPEPDPSGYGEGETAVAAATVSVPADGAKTPFVISGVLSGTPTETFFVTATARRPVDGDEDTSEFSRAIEAVLGGTEISVTNSNDSGAGSLRAAIDAANASTDRNTIVFDIPQPAAPLLPSEGFVLSNPVVIDGYTQPGSTPNTLAVGSDAKIGIVLDGSSAAGAAKGILVSAPACLIRGLVIHSFPGDGIRASFAADLRIEGNFIGTDVTGLEDRGNVSAGIFAESGAGLQVGGPVPAQRNLISANGTFGIFTGGAEARILGNIVGGDATGLGALGNHADGILAAGSDDVIGDDDPAAGNVIRRNDDAGIAFIVGKRNSILANSISDNGGLGIDLQVGQTPGVDENDSEDADEGPNSGQNYPDELDVEVTPGQLGIHGSLDIPGAANAATYTIRVFESPACDASGHGEGERFVGAADVVLSGSSKLAQEFDFSLPATVGDAASITVTATDAALGNTSEFSACVELGGSTSACGDASSDGNIAASDALATLRAAVGTGNCDLCACDVNDSGAISSSDALLVLKSAVGQGVALVCPACN